MTRTCLKVRFYMESVHNSNKGIFSAQVKVIAMPSIRSTDYRFMVIALALLCVDNVTVTRGPSR